MNEYDGPCHWVYRCFDASGRLLYVGCTRNLRSRLYAHSLTSFWSYDVVKVKATVHPDKWAGLAVEAEAIRTERPRYNVKGRWATHPTWTPDEFADYLRALESLPEARYRDSHLARVRRAAESAAERAA